jgi:phosphoesterase RecJ-like protein
VQNQTEFIYNNSVAISFITKENFENTGTSLIDGEGFSSMPLEIEGINISVLIREDLTDFRKESDNKLKTYRVSFRSFGDINIQKMALHFGGGGHINASGSTFIAEDISIVITQIKEYIITNYKFD